MNNSSISCVSCADGTLASGKKRLSELLECTYKDKPLCFIHSYGCAQNVSDGEKLAGLLADCGYEFTDDVRNAQLILLNTCAVRENAENRVFGNLGSLKALKEKDPLLIICVCGCMTQQEHILRRIEESYSYVDIAFGTYGAEELPQMLIDAISEKKRTLRLQRDGDIMSEQLRQLRKDKVSASVPIMYGCNNFCSYCIVPYVRGRERSRTPEAVEAEVRELVSSGCREITLLGQNVNSYSFGFVSLLERLNSISGDFRIRFLSSHPKDVSRELIDAILSLDKVCRHLHLPVQSGNDEMLKLMNRHYTVRDYLNIVEYTRLRDNSFSFSTDIIVGFPGETEQQYSDTRSLLKQVRFDGVYTYVYSKREGTAAARLSDSVPDSIKGQRLRELILEQRETCASWIRRFIGRTVTVLPESAGRSRGLAGKSEENIVVEFDGGQDLVGSFVNVKVTDASDRVLYGVKV